MNYPTCTAHSEHDMDCNACYLRYEHAENQTNPNATGHTVYPISRCPDCETTTELGMAALR